ncbi:MAG: ABC transporter ATP-binding protein [bacterium]
MPYAIEARHLARHFGDVKAVEGLDLQVPQGSIFGFLGPNGAGKTTTLHLLLGIVAPTAGSAQVAGFDVGTAPGEVRRRCGALLEHNGLYERLSARENLDLHGRMHRMDAADRAQRIRELLDQLGLWERRDDNVGTWSRGMKQQLAIARTLMHRPSIVFLDEPTAGHDPQAAAALRAQLPELVRQDKTTIFLTTHNLHEAEQVCDRVAVIRAGRLLAVGPPGELRTGRQEQVDVTGGPFPARGLAALRKRKDIEAVEPVDGALRLTLAPGSRLPAIVKAMIDAGMAVEEVRRVRASLEEDFLALVAAEASP